MHYNYFRYYEPGIGRYLRGDPIGLAGMEPNLYGYVLNNSVNANDPMGLIWVTIEDDYHGKRNWPRWFLNRWTRQIGKTLSPTIPLEDPEESVGWKRDVIQEWQSDPANKYRDKEHMIGARREITQVIIIYISPGPSKVLINDPNSFFYYQWTPWISKRTYEDFPNIKVEGDLWFRKRGDTGTCK